LQGTALSALYSAGALAVRRLSHHTLQASQLGNSPAKEELHE
jgi:hypothetical protein